MVLEEGQEYYYKIVKVEDIWGEPVAEGFFSDGNIILPIQGQYAPEFACYIIIREIKENSDFFK
ncbi:MAG: hypothetical protein JXA96_10860 [Sedimentisphaerales bacterium]|nr:hypothetical protein [Sedimentisphaerales bacterium]